MNDTDFQNLTDTAYALMTAPFVVFLVAIILGAAWVARK